MIKLKLAILLGTAAIAEATRVDWTGLPSSTNLTIAGHPWDDTWVAELGSFSGGFLPSAANTTEWAAAWRAASRSVYEPATGSFSGSYTYGTNAAPFLTGVRAYLWLFNPHAPQGEWILLTNPAWTWPAGSPSDASITTWTSSDATQAVVGALSGPGWSLKSATVLNSKLPALTFPEWRALYFTPPEISDPGISGSDADPDRDGASNFMEYGCGSLPRRASSFPPPVEIIFPVANNQTYFGARQRFSSRVTGYRWTANAATELRLYLALGLTVVTDLPWEYSVRWRDRLGAQPRSFIRFWLR